MKIFHIRVNEYRYQYITNLKAEFLQNINICDSQYILQTSILKKVWKIFCVMFTNMSGFSLDGVVLYNADMTKLFYGSLLSIFL